MAEPSDCPPLKFKPGVETLSEGMSAGISVEEPLAFRVVRGGLFVAASSYFNILFGFLANLVLTQLLAPAIRDGSGCRS